jgi:hypothetical protein
MIALGPMEQVAFRALMRGPLGDAYADTIVRFLINGLEVRIVLRWLKAEQATFSAVIHRWEQRPDEVMQRRYFTELRSIPAALGATSIGRLLFSLGATNVLEDGVEARCVITRAGLEQIDAAIPEEMKIFAALLNSFVFRGDWHERTYLVVIRLPAVVDTLVAANVARRLETHLAVTARERLPCATFRAHVRLSDGYHIPGQMLLCRGTQRLGLLERIDSASLRQMSYGAAAMRRVVVGGRVLEADPETFRVR